MLKLQSVHSGYGVYAVLHGISLDVQEKNIIALVGSNGAGKSTTLKTIIGTLKPKRGEIVFLGESISLKKPAMIRRMGLSLVPEGRRLFAGMTVQENLMMGAFLRDDSEINKDYEMVITMFPILQERAGQLAGFLSGGEQQMAAIGRGLMSKPKLLMIDELSLGLAPLIVKELVKQIANLRNSGLTILLVEQDVKIALRLSDYAYVLEQGEIVKEGHSNALLHDSSIIEAYLGI
jgi:branched-chain amino acid transport system ATP-binding protein